MLDGIRGLTTLVATLGVVAALASFMGQTHPALDTLAAFRVHMVIGFGALLLFSVAFAAITARFVAFVGLVIAIAGIAPSVLPSERAGTRDFRVYSHNLRFDNPAMADVITVIRARNPDIILLQEVSDANLADLSVLDREYPTQVICDFSAVGAVAVYARFALIDAPGCARGQGAAWARLRTARGDITAVSVHLPWPWPYRQLDQAARVAEILADLPEPVLIAGDFNNAPWAHSVDLIAAATGTRPVPGLRLNFVRPDFWPGLPLDHVLVSEDLAAETEMLAVYGSDHRALLSEVRIR